MSCFPVRGFDSKLSSVLNTLSYTIKHVNSYKNLGNSKSMFSALTTEAFVATTNSFDGQRKL